MTGIGKEKFNLTHGSILGISHDFFNVLAFRTSPSRRPGRPLTSLQATKRVIRPSRAPTLSARACTPARE